MQIISHEAFRLTPSYRALCDDYGLDPDQPPDGQVLTLLDAARFWRTYESLRASLSPWTAAEVAAETARLIAAHQAAAPAGTGPGPLALITTHGALIAVQTEDGAAWTAVFGEADETAVAAAAAGEAAARQCQS